MTEGCLAPLLAPAYGFTLPPLTAGFTALAAFAVPPLLREVPPCDVRALLEGIDPVLARL